MAALPEFEVFALRYASVERRASENFLMHDVHDGPMALDFYFWLIRGNGRTILVDTGFSTCSSRQRGRSFLQEPLDALAAMDIRADDVQDLILTHLHYDHAGNVDAFPRARVHLQDAEMNYATGRFMCHRALRNFFSVDDVATVLRRVYAEQVQFHDGDATLHPGIELYRVGGHTAGLQVVRVHTRRGWIVLASDALHYYRNYQTDNPFPGIFNVGEMMEGYRRLARLVETEDHIVPGHDPQVAERYPRVAGNKAEAFILHEPPKPWESSHEPA